MFGDVPLKKTETSDHEVVLDIGLGDNSIIIAI